MAINRIVLIGLSILGLTTLALAQNTSNPLRSGNTTNPILSGNTVTNGPEVPVSPALPTTILAPTTGRNSINGLPCSASAVVIPPPPSTSGSTTTQPLQSVFGSSPSC